MPQMTFTDRKVRSLPFPTKEERAQQFFERLEAGRSLVLHLSYGARTKTWRVLFYENGKPHTKRIGTYPELSIKDARKVARKFDAEGAIASSRAGTFKQVSDKWLVDYVDKKKLRTAYEIRRQLKKHLLPRWGKRDFHEIDRGDVHDLMRSIEKKHGTSMAEHVLATIRSIMTWHSIWNRHYVPAVTPKMRVDMRERDERSRKRILNDDEIRSVWAATEGMGVYGAFCRVLLLTGQRFGAVKAMKWRHLDGDLWLIPDERRAKGTIGAVRLPVLCASIIERLPRIANNEYVFAGDKRNRPFGSFSRMKKQLDRALPDDMPEWVLHDLRRTARSLLARAQVPDHIAERVLGHRLQGVEAVYNRHSYLTEKSEALVKLSNLVGEILDPSSGNVIHLRKKTPE